MGFCRFCAEPCEGRYCSQTCDELDHQQGYSPDDGDDEGGDDE